MLEKLSYLGHELTSSSFKLLIKDPIGKGYYRYNVGIDDSFNFSEIKNGEEHLKNEIIISAVATVNGNERESDDSVFTLEVKFFIRFELDKEDYIEKDYAKENKWFFLNFASIASKEIIDSILNNTALKSTFIPSHRLPEA